MSSNSRKRPCPSRLETDSSSAQEQQHSSDSLATISSVIESPPAKRVKQARTDDGKINKTPESKPLAEDSSSNDTNMQKLLEDIPARVRQRLLSSTNSPILKKSNLKRLNKKLDDSGFDFYLERVDVGHEASKSPSQANSGLQTIPGLEEYAPKLRKGVKLGAGDNVEAERRKRLREEWSEFLASDPDRQ